MSKYKYFVSYVASGNVFVNAEIELDGKIESMEDVKDLEEMLEGEGVILLAWHELPQ